MKKPIYKRWGFWVVVLVVGGIIGIFNGDDDPVEVATPTATVEPAQDVVAEVISEPTAEATTEPTEAPIEAPVIAESQAVVPSYEIIDERLDKSGMWYLTLSTESTDEAQLKALVENGRLLALERDNGATCVFTDIQHPNDDKVNIAVGKIALTEKGVMQTGLKDTKDIEFEIIK
ncbi:hypothetical protein [Paenibacillus wynnii]|uniref:hypothetical protein n=1 Tax=Paenibacillus wynnii TaxID=268407 RepID=UPI00068EC4C6|nr:hypothetical protein [Paenibacillus wynnii]